MSLRAERRRVEIAALAANPAFILLDEPSPASTRCLRHPHARIWPERGMAC